MDQRKIQVSEVEAYNNKLTNIKAELESKLNSYINHLNNLSNDNAIEGAVRTQLDEFCSDIKNFLNTEVSEKLESFTNFLKKDIESVKSTDSSTATKIASILGNESGRVRKDWAKPPRFDFSSPTHNAHSGPTKEESGDVYKLTRPDISQWTKSY